MCMSGDEPRTGTEAPETDGTPASPSGETESSATTAAEASDADAGFELSRRKALVGGAGLFVGAGVGAGATFATSGSDEVRKQKPNSDGRGTLGELRWILEEKHGLAVTSMVVAEETVRVEYESSATSRTESRREIGSVISAYGLVVANDGPTAKLTADIQRGFEKQATSYHVQAEWVKKWRSGDLSDASVTERVFNTRRFPESASKKLA